MSEEGGGALLELMIKFHVGAAVRDKLAGGGRPKKKAKSSKPEAVEQEGTYYRVINAILHPSAKQYYLLTGGSFDRAELDGKAGHRDKWSKIHEIYSDTETGILNEMNVKYHSDIFNALSIPNNTPETYDVLSLDDFIATVNYVNFHYKSAKQNNERSGQHGDFPDYINGKVWLVFYNSKLAEIGDVSLDNMVCPILNDNVFMDPGKLKVQQEQKKIVREQKKHGKKRVSAADLRKASSISDHAITSAVEESAIRSKRERVRVMMTRVHELKLRMGEIKKDSDLSASDKKQSRKFVKKQLKLAETEYNELKVDLDWSSDVSDPSDSSDGDESENYQQ